MTLFSAFVSSLAIVSCRVSRSSECTKLSSSRDDIPPRKVVVTCSDTSPCPPGSQCMRLLGREGFCVLHVDPASR